MSAHSTSTSGEGSLSSSDQEFYASASHQRLSTATSNPSSSTTSAQPSKRKRNFPGNPDPEAEVVALSPRTLLATNKFVCDVCDKGFRRDQNLQLHLRLHKQPWKLTRGTSKQMGKRVYICPVQSCVHHDRSRALGDLTGIKKHFSRKHGEKKWTCARCCKGYAVHSDWKAHYKTCGNREYRCEFCGFVFDRRDILTKHKAYCAALAEERAKVTAGVHSAAPSDHFSAHRHGPNSGGAVDMMGPSCFGVLPGTGWSNDNSRISLAGLASSSAGNGSASQNLPSISLFDNHNQMHTPSNHVPGTSLLQNATMAATASDTDVIGRGLGLAGLGSWCVELKVESCIPMHDFLGVGSGTAGMTGAPEEAAGKVLSHTEVARGGITFLGESIL